MRRVGRPKKLPELAAASDTGVSEGAPETTRDRILDVAEAAFADGGYDGTSLMDVAQRAGVNQALIRYYFGAKQDLFAAIYLRRGQALSQARLNLLDDLERNRDKPPMLEQVVRAFLAPSLEMRRSGGGLAYLRLQARLTNETTDQALTLRRQVHDETARRYIKAFQRARPDIEPSTMYWRMVFLLGCFFYAMSDTNRIDIMSAGAVKGSDFDALERQLVAFLVGGLSAPLPAK